MLKLYIWQLPTTSIYKIGVTNNEDPMVRIRNVMNTHNFSAEVVGVWETPQAYGYEQRYLKLGKMQYFVLKGQGYTEFLHYDAAVMQMIVGELTDELGAPKHAGKSFAAVNEELYNAAARVYMAGYAQLTHPDGTYVTPRINHNADYKTVVEKLAEAEIELAAQRKVIKSLEQIIQNIVKK